MRGTSLSDVDYEILDLLVQDDETVAIILHDLRNPNNAASFSAAAKALDFDGVEAILRRLVERGLVQGHQEPSDGFQMEPGVTYTWWRLTDDGRRAWEAWDAAQPE